jgi:hypothetical protein
VKVGDFLLHDISNREEISAYDKYGDLVPINYTHRNAIITDQLCREMMRMKDVLSDVLYMLGAVPGHEAYR